MIYLLFERSHSYQEGENSNADKHLKDTDCDWRFFSKYRNKNWQAYAKHIEDEEELSKDVSLSEAIINHLEANPSFMKFHGRVDGFSLVRKNGKSCLLLLFDEIEDSIHHCEHTNEKD